MQLAQHEVEHLRAKGIPMDVIHAVQGLFSDPAKLAQLATVISELRQLFAATTNTPAA
jgi:hypothetical protein